MGYLMSQPKTVQVANPQSKEIYYTYKTTGRITAHKSVDIIARVSGWLQERYFEEGDIVRKGQKLFLIEPDEYILAAKNARATVNENTVQDYELQLSQAWSFYKLGKKAKIDVVTAEYNLGKAKLNLVKAQNVLQVAKAELAKIMGIPEHLNFDLSDELSLNGFDITVGKAILLALDVRPELMAAKKNMDAAELNLSAKRRQYTPDLGIFASYRSL